MKPETITIDEVKYVRADSVEHREMSKDIRIVIAHRGFVYVGRIEKEGTEVRILNAKNVRRWGTTKGLGELAEKGPLPETILDDYGIVRIHELAIVNSIDCSSSWEEHV